MKKYKPKQELRMLVGSHCYKNKQNDYFGKIGVIEVCNKCCGGSLRIQFIGIGNNERLDSFNLDGCRFFLADIQ